MWHYRYRMRNLIATRVVESYNCCVDPGDDPLTRQIENNAGSVAGFERTEHVPNRAREVYCMYICSCGEKTLALSFGKLLVSKQMVVCDYDSFSRLYIPWCDGE